MKQTEDRSPHLYSLLAWRLGQWHWDYSWGSRFVQSLEYQSLSNNCQWLATRSVPRNVSETGARPALDENKTLPGSYSANSYLADCGIWHSTNCVRESWIKCCSQLARQAVVTGDAAPTGIWEPPTSDLGERHRDHRIVIGRILECPVGEGILPWQLDLLRLGQELRSLDHAVHGRDSTNMWVERVWQSIESLHFAEWDVLRFRRLKLAYPVNSLPVCGWKVFAVVAGALR